MNTDERVREAITGLELDTGTVLDVVDVEVIIYALKRAGIELFEAAPAPRQETSQ